MSTRRTLLGFGSLAGASVVAQTLLPVTTLTTSGPLPDKPVSEGVPYRTADMTASLKGLFVHSGGWFICMCRETMITSPDGQTMYCPNKSCETAGKHFETPRFFVLEVDQNNTKSAIPANGGRFSRADGVWSVPE